MNSIAGIVIPDGTKSPIPMTEQRAREILTPYLSAHGPALIIDGSVAWIQSDERAMIGNHSLTADELEAVAFWMRTHRIALDGDSHS